MKSKIFLLFSFLLNLFSPHASAVSLGESYGYDPLQGATYRANLLRDGNWKVKNAPKLSAKKWEFKTGGAVKASPVMANGLIYIGSEDKNFYALDAATGKEKWKFGTGGAIFTSATVYDGKVVFTSMDHKVYALDALTGAKKWEHAVPMDKAGFYYVSPGAAYGLIFVSQGTATGWEVTSWGGSLLIGLDPETGEKIWEQKGKTGPDCMSSIAITPEGKMIFDTDWNFSTCLDLKSGKYDWNERFTGRNMRGAYYSTHAVGDGIAVGVIAIAGPKNGTAPVSEVIAIDVKSGKKIWSLLPYDKLLPTNMPEDGGDHRAWAAPALAEGMVFTGNNDGHIYTYDLKTGKEKWRTKVGGSIRSAPSYSSGKLYFGADDGFVHCLETATGKETGKIKIGGKTISSPTLGEGMLIIGDDSGLIHCFD